MDFIFAVILILLSIGGVVVRKTYYYLPARELKRQAEKQDWLAARFYRAVAYGNSLRGLLWLFISLTAAGGFVLLARSQPVWLSLLVVLGSLWAAFSWLPASRVTRLGAKLTSLVTPLVAKILSFVHPVMDRTVDTVSRRYSAPPHTGIFERQDFLELVEKQQRQADSRLTDEELAIMKNALRFSDHKVADILIPRKQVKTVLADDTVGPILIDELHKSGQEFVLVRDKKNGMVVGSLEFHKLGLDSKGKVKDLMNGTVYYLHESDSLSEALHAFFVTNHPLFIVVNSFEEFVGIITVENILEQLLGHVPGDDFDQYADMKAVASRHVKARKSEKMDEEPVKTDEEVVE